MKAPDWFTANEYQVWKYVAWHLAESGIETVLVGGAVCAIYSEGAYKSGDLDFVSRSILDSQIHKILKVIGFIRQPEGHYEHSECSYFLEFVPGPVGIGDDVNIELNHEEVNGNKLYLFSPTDCIRDRLASYIHFKAQECLDQAALVAKKLPFDHSKVKKWCQSEGAKEAYADLLQRIKTLRV